MHRQSRNNRSTKPHRIRKGAATAEFAMLLPVLVLITFGAIDAGQCINVSQIVNEASREGARLASRSDTTDVEEVESAVEAYIADAFPGETAAAMAAAVTVQIGDSYGIGIPAGNLSTIESGTPITVRVVLEYDSVRWLKYLPGFDAMAIETETVMRHE
jgi:Flp pilus assembly protein TadG